MKTTSSTELLSAAAIARELNVSEPKVKKAIKKLAIRPTAKRGVCCLYARDELPKIKTAIGSGN